MLALFRPRATARTTAAAIYAAFQDGLRALTPYPTRAIATDPGRIREAVFLIAATARAVLLTDRTTTDPITIQAHRRLCDQLAIALGPFQPPGPIFDHLLRYDAILQPYLPTQDPAHYDALIAQYLALSANDYTPHPPTFSLHDTPRLRQWLNHAITTTHQSATHRLTQLRP